MTTISLGVKLFFLAAVAEAALFGEDPWEADKYETTEFVTIPPGRSDRNTFGYQQYGSYSTVLNQKGQYDLELQLVLEGPLQRENFVYQQWFQFIDPIESLKTDDEEDDFHESLTCNFLYQTNIGGNGVNFVNSQIQGYKGEERLKEAVGEFDVIANIDKSSTFPWFLDLEKSKLEVTDDTIRMECVLFRDFITDWSEIPITMDTIIDWHSGYRVYSNDEATSPVAKGYAENLKMEIKYLGASLSQAMSALAVSALLISQTF